MVRRPFIAEPLSGLAAWSSRLGIFALVVAALSAVILRSGFLDAEPALATFGAALACAVVAILLALLSFVSIWRQGYSGLGRALLGLVLGFALLAYPAYLATVAYKLPAIADVTTDTANPPRFESLARQRPSNRIAYPGAAAAKLQQAAYPDIVPLQLALPARTAYDVALGVISKHKWPVGDTRPPAGNREGIIEATARTLVMGLRDDVVIRITPLGRASRIDLRSASRVGSHDLGANAARLRTLLEEIDEAAGNAPEPKAEPEPQQPKRPVQRRTQPQKPQVPAR